MKVANEHLINNSTSQFVLASSSPRRKELVALLDLSLPVSIFSIDTDEVIDPTWSPSETVQNLSTIKAKAVHAVIEQGEAPSDIDKQSALLLAADTVVALDQTILGKPASREEAYDMLCSLRGKTHQVYTGVTLLHTGSGQMEVSYRATNVTMHSYSDAIIKRYIATGESDDKAGAYGIQGKGANLVDSIEGCYFNVVGLPVSLVAQMLQQFQVDILQSHS